MNGITEKQIEELRAAFVRNLGLDFFEDDEIGHVLKEIDSFDLAIRQKVLALCLSLSHQSSALVPRVLSHIKTVAEQLLPEDLDLWLSTAFDFLDSQGLDQALRFLAKVNETDLREFQVPQGLRLREVAPVLDTYLRGLSGQDLKVEQHDLPYTDTVTVHLPPLLTRFAGRERNFVLYKLAAAHLWAQIASGTLGPAVDVTVLKQCAPDYPLDHPDLETFFRLLPDPELALDGYTVLEAIRLDGFLRRELPGLMRQAEEVKQALFEDRPELSTLPGKNAVIEALYQYHLAERTKGRAPDAVERIIPRLASLRGADGPASSLRILFTLIDQMKAAPGAYEPQQPPLFLGRIRPDKVSRTLNELKQARKNRLQAVLAKFSEMPEPAFPDQKQEKRAHPEKQLDPDQQFLLLKGRLIEVEKDLQEFIDEQGGVPGGLLVTGSELGTGSPVTLADLLDEEEVESKPGGILYDEWDYKRGGYRKDWCSLYEQDIPPGHTPFVELTLKRYGGYVNILRKRFELLKREPKALRRQKDGEDIDLDAVVEAFADLSAGISPGENLFTKFDRQERNIAVLFLIDMSGSTKGWVNTAEKESLVLMGEALDALGDRYAIYGFSGMTRNRCDLYRIKAFDEGYGESVKRRIAGIEPKDYTRMGPFIRHATKVLKSVEARTRLLITLSDGKPEDWDAYKGDYGIEDTRKALIESREQGIHPFCITIDKEAQSYLPHMYGEVNYIFIDDVRKLPNRITEIYRRLTS